MRRPYAAWNAPKGGNAVLTKFISWESFWFPKLSYNAPKGGNAVLTQDDQVSEVAILLGRLMQYRFRVWNDYGGAVDYTLKEFRSRTKVSDSFFEKIILFLNRYWYYSRYLPVSLVVE